jgi:hypothetical protein
MARMIATPIFSAEGFQGRFAFEAGLPAFVVE